MTSAPMKSLGLRIAEERGDVDEDGVEQRREFISAGLQDVQVFLERGVSGVVHAMTPTRRISDVRL